MIGEFWLGKKYLTFRPDPKEVAREEGRIWDIKIKSGCWRQFKGGRQCEWGQMSSYHHLGGVEWQAS